MSDSLLQRSVTSGVARHLAHTAKTAPKMMSITPRLLIDLLPWVNVSSGTFRVNRTRIELSKAKRIEIDWIDQQPIVNFESLRSVPLFANMQRPLLEVIAKNLRPQSVSLGHKLLVEGESNGKFLVIAQGQVEILSKGMHGSNLRIRLLTDGEYFGESELAFTRAAGFTVETRTPCVLLTLARSELETALQEAPQLLLDFQKNFDEHLLLESEVNVHGERNIDLVSGFAENVEIPETFVDYCHSPREYNLSAIQTVVRVHTRVSDLYNDPYDQLTEQMRLTIEGIKERQEWELINNNRFGLIHSVDPAMRISPRYGAPTPDDLDDLLALVWKKPAFFLAHPKAIAAFERECTWRGVPPATATIAGVPVLTWRGVPLVPCDKLEIKSRHSHHLSTGTTNILLVRVGEENQGIVGLHQAGIPGELSPSLSARFMGLDSLGVSSYLLTLYFACAALTDDAIGILENVELGHYHDYSSREDQGFVQGLGI